MCSVLLGAFLIMVASLHGNLFVKISTRRRREMASNDGYQGSQSFVWARVTGVRRAWYHLPGRTIKPEPDFWGKADRSISIIS
jgi:hypothetical protein